MGINYFLPDFFYTKKIEKHQEIKEDLYTHIQSIDTDSLARPWNLCNVRSSYIDSNPRAEINQFLYKNEAFTNAIWETYDEMLDTDFIKNSINYRFPKQSKLESVWFNMYDAGDYQEIHNHIFMNCLYTCLYILHDESKTGMCVHSSVPTIDQYCAGGVVDTRQMGYSEGHMLIFPSYTPHYVSPATGSRVTIAGNIMSR